MGTEREFAAGSLACASGLCRLGGSLALPALRTCVALELAEGFAGGGGDEAGHGADGDVGADEADGAVAHAGVHAGGVKGVGLAVIGAIDGGVAGTNILRVAGNAAVEAIFVGF